MYIESETTQRGYSVNNEYYTVMRLLLGMELSIKIKVIMYTLFY